MMQILQEKILRESTIKNNGIIQVDHFLNHQLDVPFLCELGKEFHRRFKDQQVTKILTIEASGIAIASLAAQYFDVPVVFAKKTESRNLDEETYTSNVFSYTRGRPYPIRVSRRYLTSTDRVLILDDFLANGQAILGLYDIVCQANATLVGVGIVIEKGFQPGGEMLRRKNIVVESLAIVEKIEDGKITFRS